MEADPSFFPAFMVDRPDLWPHLVFYSEAFSELSTARQIGLMGGAGQIPWPAIDRYGERHGVDDPDAFDLLRRMIRAQDRVYLDHMAEAEKDKDKGKKI